MILILKSHPLSGWSMVKFSEMVMRAVKDRDDIINLTPVSYFSRKFSIPALRRIFFYFERKIITPVHLLALVTTHRPKKIIITDHSDAHLALLVPRTPRITFCHDLFAIRAMLKTLPNPGQSIRTKLELKINYFFLKNSRQIIAVSNATANQISKFLPEKNFEIISPTVIRHEPQPLMPIIDREYCILPMNNDWRKNRARGIEVWVNIRKCSDKDLLLVIVGNNLTDEENNFLVNNSLIDDIRILQNISEIEMHSLLKHCEFVLFTSYYEGFGLPIIEANFYSRIAIHSDIDALMEVGGNANICIPNEGKNIDWNNICNSIYDQTLRNNARKHFDEKYSFAIFQEKINKLLSANNLE